MCRADGCWWLPADGCRPQPHFCAHLGIWYLKQGLSGHSSKTTLQINHHDCSGNHQITPSARSTRLRCLYRTYSTPWFFQTRGMARPYTHDSSISCCCICMLMDLEHIYRNFQLHFAEFRISHHTFNQYHLISKFLQSSLSHCHSWALVCAGFQALARMGRKEVEELSCSG